ncbi:hypothetical protein [Comamonas sp. CMM02]|uniref:hypothetical protein n=1 Tax=Comamonas sp. CMM02 TaxID=2769307 RepID=UPI00177CF48A|nr:hypothetical protein [Comamonas sp. CMM02]MBD9400989.1 hypothetical protein [Comamonas sp. CMM02]
MTPLDQHHHNDVRGLRWISDFGWLRTAELSALMFTGMHAHKQAERLVRSWRRRGLVLERKLPERAGRALMLAARGVQLLAEAGFATRSGKDIGETINGTWRPPLTWMHDLLAAQVLVELRKRGFGILPEAVLRRSAGALTKMPDGLAIKGAQVIWLEVESARKTGPAMRQMAEALSAVAAGKAEAVCGHRPTHAMVAYLAQARDERGHALSHRSRVMHAVAASTHSDMPLTFACCTRQGAVGVGRIEFTEETVIADRTNAILRRLDAAGWYVDDETQVNAAHYGGYTAYVWQDSDAPGTWSYHAENASWSAPAGYAGSIEEAKQHAASLISMRILGV